MNTRMCLVVIFVMMVVSSVFQQLSIMDLKKTVAVQKKAISVQDNTITKLKNGIITISERNMDATIGFCDAIDKYRRLLGLPDEHFGDKARVIKKEHNYDGFK